MPCRCFGSSTTPLGRRHVVRNTLLTTAAAAGLVGVLAGAPDGLTSGGAVLAVVAGLRGCLVVMFDDVVDLVAASSSS